MNQEPSFLINLLHFIMLMAWAFLWFSITVNAAVRLTLWNVKSRWPMIIFSTFVLAPLCFSTYHSVVVNIFFGAGISFLEGFKYALNAKFTLGFFMIFIFIFLAGEGVKEEAEIISREQKTLGNTGEDK
ncbi:hypothetical protein ACPV5Q_00270 [Vibrio astriarenae]